jgi:tRNA(Ile)-lysidine synthase
MRLVTGSGIAGLRGIHPVRDDGFIRPLLAVPREEIEAFLREREITPRLDRSNEDPRFLRNRVRTIVRELNAVDNLAAAAEQAREQWPVLASMIDDAEPAAREGRWPAERWLRQALLGRLVRRLDPGARDFDAGRLAAELDRIKRASVSKHVELIRRGERLVLERRPEPVAQFEIEFERSAYVPALDLTIHVLAVPKEEENPHPDPLPARRGEGTGRQRFQLPDDAPPAFLVRNRRDGDRFQPLGLSGTKKLKDFLIDRRIPANARDRLPLLVWHDEIVWIGGVEVSERFKVTRPTAGMLYEVWMEGSGAEHHSRLHRGTDPDANP